MATRHQNNQILKIVLLGALVAALVYLFHPGVAQFSLLINGEPISDPFFRVAAIPALMLVLMMIGILTFLAMVGVGVMMFAFASALTAIGILIIAPYFWPVLLIIAMIVLILSPVSRK